MLNIIDINTNAANLDFIEALKADFRSELAPTVKEGTVVIISNFPAVGNMLSKIDFLVMINIPKKQGNYLKLRIDHKNRYIHNAVLMIKQVEDDQIISADDAALYTKVGEFDYQETLAQAVYDFRDHCLGDAAIWPFAVYHLKSAIAPNFYNSRISLNHTLTAKYLIWAIIRQTYEKGFEYGTSSMGNGAEAFQLSDQMVNFCRTLLEKGNAGAKYGILTKAKIDQLARPSKVIDDVLVNVGKSLSIISGKAGTGKTLALTKVLNKYRQERHHVRFLTYNNLLVFDIKQLLRNFPNSDTQLSALSVHSFFYKLSHTLGIPLLLSQERIEELMGICRTRIEGIRNSYLSLMQSSEKTVEELLRLCSLAGGKRVDMEETSLFARTARGQKWPAFEEIAEKYLANKKAILTKNIGSEIFLQDYYKVLELLYLAVTDTRQFYEDMGIQNRYELLSTLYDTDKYIEPISEGMTLTEFRKRAQIPIENVLDRVRMVERQVGWSKLMLIDESQDFHVYEKELLFKLRRPENIVVATGGKEQLIRHSKLLDWGLSFNKKIAHIPFRLRNRSFRQKANIVSLVNAFGEQYGIPIQLESVAESAGLGKIIIDLRPKTGFVPVEIARELQENGKINGCSEYESLMFLVPSKGYTDKVTDENFAVSDNDVVTYVKQTTGRKFKFKKELLDMDILCWDGVSENKSSLKIPQQNETRVIHYESCRGLEAWSCALIGLDAYFEHKRISEEAAKHLGLDLFLTEDQERDKYAALWVLMAFTRPMDTLYIQLDRPNSPFSTRLLEIAARCEGVNLIR